MNLAETNLGLTDIHAHFLWGIDDGPTKPEGMYQLIRDAHSQGIVRFTATPHVRPGYRPFDAGKYRDRLHEAREFCRAQNPDMEIIAGAEVAWTYQTAYALRQRTIPTLGETDYVLIELGCDITLKEAYSAVRSVEGAGYLPVLAHVERCRCFAWAPWQALRFREKTGALFQMNADTVLRPRGLVEKYFRNLMIRERAIDVVASDAHGGAGRPVNLRRAYNWLLAHTDQEYAGLLTCFSYE